MNSKEKSIDIWHNILWSKYKAGVFSELNSALQYRGVQAHFFQIAETDAQRVNLSGVDYSAHRYPFELLFKGNLNQVNLIDLLKKVINISVRSRSTAVIIAGYDRPEYWAQLLICKIKLQQVGVFCDSTRYDRKQSFFKGLAKWLFFKQCDQVFCYGQRAQEYVMSFGVPRRKLVKRCQAAALPADYNVSAIPAMRRAYRSNGKQRFLYVGRLSKEKNLEVLIESFALHLKKFPDAELRIIGSGPDQTILQDLALETGCAHAVDFAGSRESNTLPQEYLSASVMILPSLSEPWGLVVNEALSYGCPVVVSDRCGCIPELVIDGNTGYQFSAESVDDLAEKMELGEQLSANIDDCAEKCLVLMSNFTPRVAATQIAEGIDRMFEI